MMDDFCLDEDAGVAYVTTHRDNTIERMSLEPDRIDENETVAGSSFDEELVERGVGTRSWGIWSRSFLHHGWRDYLASR
jgi:hypothetical protein